jgi:hypothetical protein
MPFTPPNADTRQHVRGTLVPMNPDAVTESTPVAIYNAIRDNGLIISIDTKETRWASGIIDINSNTRAFGGHHVGLLFISMLDKFLRTTGVAELGLKGKLMIVTDTSTIPSIFQVSVESGTVTYQQANIGWDEPVTVEPQPPATSAPFCAHCNY